MEYEDRRVDVLIATRSIPLVNGRGQTAKSILDARSEPRGSCLLWQGPPDRDGYGRVKLQGQDYLVHRVAYTIERGEITAGYTIDHTCRDHACINVDHLEVVTLQENQRRRGRSTTTHCPNGHLWADDNIRPIRRASGLVDKFCRACSREQARERRRRAA
ncbi:MAG: hypothetical protein CMH34_05230 [Microbacterium sp.]|nr:hypothetical protein [Microbacterium sp.]|tara:strand:- start:53 stop:532 length:480 start_codon:yes stop_codon:yes gene_type:complete